MFKLKYFHIELNALSLICLGLIAFYLFRFFSFGIPYMPYGTDEFLYFLEAKNISLHLNWDTPVSFDGVLSKWGDFGIHGWAYGTYNAFIAWLSFSPSNPNLVLANVLLIAFAIFSIVRNNSFNSTQKAGFISLILSFHVVLRYTFTFYQESLQILFGVLLSSLLIAIYSSIDAKKRAILITQFILLILLYTQFRYNGFLWGFGLAPLFLIDKKYLNFILISIPALCIYGFLSNTLWVAPFPYDTAFNYVFIEAIQQKPFGELLQWFMEHWMGNINEFLFEHENWYKAVMRYTFLGMSGWVTYIALKQKKALDIAIAAIAWMYFITNTALYDVHWEYDQRTLAIAMVLLFAWAIHSLPKQYIIGLILFNLIPFVPVMRECNDTLQNTLALNNNPVRNQRIAAFEQIAKTDLGENPIVLSPVELILFNHSNEVMYLPLQDNAGHPILYSFFKFYNGPAVKVKANYEMRMDPNFGAFLKTDAFSIQKY
jgi:hypothetical protein